METHNIISTPEITGNIGSCSIKSEEYSVGTFHSETTAVNSCTGQIISQHQYVDSAGVMATIMIIGMILFLVVGGLFSIITKK